MKKLILSVIILAAVLIGVNYFVSTRGTIEILPASEVQINQPVGPVVQEDYIRYPGRDGANTFELLLEQTEVEFTQYDFGKFIQAINGVTPDSKHFWKLYINGQGSQVGAEDLQTSEGDVVEWRLEEIEGEV